MGKTMLELGCFAKTRAQPRTTTTAHRRAQPRPTAPNRAQTRANARNRSQTHATARSVVCVLRAFGRVLHASCTRPARGWARLCAVARVLRACQTRADCSQIARRSRANCTLISHRTHTTAHNRAQTHTECAQPHADSAQTAHRLRADAHNRAQTARRHA